MVLTREYRICMPLTVEEVSCCAKGFFDYFIYILFIFFLFFCFSCPQSHEHALCMCQQKKITYIVALKLCNTPIQTPISKLQISRLKIIFLFFSHLNFSIKLANCT